MHDISPQTRQLLGFLCMHTKHFGMCYVILKVPCWVARMEDGEERKGGKLRGRDNWREKLRTEVHVAESMKWWRTALLKGWSEEPGETDASSLFYRWEQCRVFWGCGGPRAHMGGGGPFCHQQWSKAVVFNLFHWWHPKLSYLILWHTYSIFHLYCCLKNIAGSTS